ncbi:MAG: WbqC family protein [Saprospiraceae bacterium]|jgi:hypothetical protein|nr:WbqC family protein [Saprospiraceae bacterium]
MKTKDTILLELQYLPSIQYFTKLISHEITLIEQYENYLKGTYRNRCHIVGANGLQRLSIPLEKGKNEKQPIREVKISDHENWQAQHWNSIKSAYGKSPYFEYYVDELEPFFKKKYEFLFEWNWDLINCIIDCLSIECELKWTTEYLGKQALEEEKSIFDFRNGIHPKIHRQKEDPHFKPAKYAQVFQEKHGFISNLSILDLLFCSGPESYRILEGSVV